MNAFVPHDEGQRRRTDNGLENGFLIHARLSSKAVRALVAGRQTASARPPPDQGRPRTDAGLACSLERCNKKTPAFIYA